MVQKGTEHLPRPLGGIRVSTWTLEGEGLEFELRVRRAVSFIAANIEANIEQKASSVSRAKFDENRRACEVLSPIRDLKKNKEKTELVHYRLGDNGSSVTRKCDVTHILRDIHSKALERQSQPDA